MEAHRALAFEASNRERWGVAAIHFGKVGKIDETPPRHTSLARSNASRPNAKILLRLRFVAPRRGRKTPTNEFCIYSRRRDFERTTWKPIERSRLKLQIESVGAWRQSIFGKVGKIDEKDAFSILSSSAYAFYKLKQWETALKQAHDAKRWAKTPSETDRAINLIEAIEGESNP